MSAPGDAAYDAAAREGVAALNAWDRASVGPGVSEFEDESSIPDVAALREAYEYTGDGADFRSARERRRGEFDAALDEVRREHAAAIVAWLRSYHYEYEARLVARQFEVRL